MSPGQALLATQEDEEEGGNDEKQLHLCSLLIVGGVSGWLSVSLSESMSQFNLQGDIYTIILFCNTCSIMDGNLCPPKNKIKYPHT